MLIPHVLENVPVTVPQTIHSVPEAYIDRILAPYFPHCRYAKSCEVVYDPTPCNGVIPKSISARANFSIPQSCYIEDTGHFNAVEFVICYNQLGYLFLSRVLCLGLIKTLRAWELEAFEAKQLSDVLILQITSTFRKEINARDFQGVMHLDGARVKAGQLFLKTRIEFSDAEGGYSGGDALICMRDAAPALRAEAQ